MPVWIHSLASPLEALASAKPFEEPEVSVLEAIPKKELVSLAVDKLEPTKRLVIEAVFYGQKISYRKLGGYCGIHGLIEPDLFDIHDEICTHRIKLSKSQIHRIALEALSDLRTLLSVAE